jgi:hypothetical protein
VYELEDLILFAIEQQRFVDDTFTVPLEALNDDMQVYTDYEPWGLGTIASEDKISNKKVFTELKIRLSALLALTKTRVLYPGLWQSPESEGSQGMWQAVVKEYLEIMSTLCQKLSFTRRKVIIGNSIEAKPLCNLS